MSVGDARVGAADAAICAAQAGVASSCVAHLCKADGVTVLALEQDEPWSVGALGWVALVCGHSLAWPAAATADQRQQLYLVAREDVLTIEAGGQVQIFYGQPGEQTSARPRMNCTFRASGAPPACRMTPYPLARDAGS